MAALFVALGIALALAFLLLLILHLPVEVRVRARFSGGQPDYLVAAGVKLGARRLTLFQLRPGPDTSRKPPASESREAPARDVRDLFWRAKEQIAQFRDRYPGLKDALSQAVRVITVTEFSLRASVGIGDAFETAVIAGGLRAAAGMALSHVRKFGLKFQTMPRVAVRPVYDRRHFSAELDVGAVVKPYRAVPAATALLREVRRAAPRSVVPEKRRWNTKA